MIGFFKSLLGGGSGAEKIMQDMLDRSQKWQVLGAEIADECLKSGLRKGEIVKLSDITTFIKQSYTYNGNVVENGFLNKMSEYIDSGEVLSISAETGDIVFIHKNHVNDLIGNTQEGHDSGNDLIHSKIGKTEVAKKDQSHCPFCKVSLDSDQLAICPKCNKILPSVSDVYRNKRKDHGHENDLIGSKNGEAKVAKKNLSHCPFCKVSLASDQLAICPKCNKILPA